MLWLKVFLHNRELWNPRKVTTTLLISSLDIQLLWQIVAFYRIWDPDWDRDRLRCHVHAHMTDESWNGSSQHFSCMKNEKCHVVCGLFQVQSPQSRVLSHQLNLWNSNNLLKKIAEFYVAIVVRMQVKFSSWPSGTAVDSGKNITGHCWSRLQLQSS